MGKAAARSDARAARLRPLPLPLSLHIRPAGPTDAERVAELRRQAERFHAGLMPDYFREASGRGPEAGRSGSAFLTVVAEAMPSPPPAKTPSSSRRSASTPRSSSSGEIVGYATLRIVDTPRDPALVPRRRAHVETVVVDERRRRRGVGTALMQALASWARAREATELVLTVWSRNAAALALYRRLGYQPVAQVLRLPVTP